MYFLKFFIKWRRIKKILVGLWGNYAYHLELHFFPFLAHSVPSTILNTEFVSLLYKPKHSCSCILISQFSFLRYVKEYFSHISAQSSLSIFPQKNFRECEDTYFILQNKYIFRFTKIVLDQIYLEMIASLV